MGLKDTMGLKQMPIYTGFFRLVTELDPLVLAQAKKGHFQEEASVGVNVHGVLGYGDAKPIRPLTNYPWPLCQGPGSSWSSRVTWDGTWVSRSIGVVGINAYRFHHIPYTSKRSMYAIYAYIGVVWGSM